MKWLVPTIEDLPESLDLNLRPSDAEALNRCFAELVNDGYAIDGAWKDYGAGSSIWDLASGGISDGNLELKRDQIHYALRYGYGEIIGQIFDALGIQPTA